ncbi:NLR family CARD domain-containing protein 3-like isoform X1 [Anguilla anguilla]|uniref:NLR family CARD domain-containing protein 3-like isoform X1 n=1 Tax=Anguilla anguilla TaxID=7936 RepID=UPI0015AC812A|nr:NLR family CARD domain-containing protein 3-like isoform X1 [Anguilla anguilla]
MGSPGQILQAHRDSLLLWTKPNPAPLLRWLRDDGVLSHAQYLSLLERSPSNAVAAALEAVRGREEASRGFLEVLREVQGYYCEELQAWAERHCGGAVPDRTAEPAPVCEEEKKKEKGSFAKIFKSKCKGFKVPQEKKGAIPDSKLKPRLSVKQSNLRVPLMAHKKTLLNQTERLTSHSEGGGMVSNSHSHIEIRYTDLFVTEDNEEFESSQHEYFSLASRRARIYAHQDCQRIQPCHLLSKQRATGCPPKRVKVKGIAGIGKSVAIGVDSEVPVSELVVALVKGSLLPEVSVILTSRPSTDAPKRFFQRCCVVLGFEEAQVEEYTSKFFKDTPVASRVYGYIVGNDSLFVLSFIPLYCYIICTALAEFFTGGRENGHGGEGGDRDGSQSLELNPPRTVSEVYYCYLYTAIKHHALRGTSNSSVSKSEVFSIVRAQLTSLGKLAYENLLRSKIMFDRADLESFGLEPREVRSTFLSQILVSVEEEKVEMFAFFHLTVQEHLAALYCAVNLSSPEHILGGLEFWCFGQPLPSTAPPLLLAPDFRSDQTRVENLQMFTRFFMGLVRARLGNQLTGMEPVPLDKEDLLSQLGVWFKTQFKGRELSNQTALNLLHCLTELHMEEVAKAVAPEIKSLNLFKMKLSVVDCAALYYVLRFSPHRLEELNLGYSNIGNRGLRRLGPILHRCESLYLRYNCLDRDAAILESAILKSGDCQVKKLFMCGNSLGSEGVRELWLALEENSTVEELYLDITGITEGGTENMVNCLSKNSALKTLTLVGNEIGEAGKDRLRELRRLRPGLRVIGNFVDDLGLLQAYLDWVEELRADRDQMDSVRNVDALQSVLKGLRVAGAHGEGQNVQKAKELETKILQLLETPT